MSDKPYMPKGKATPFILAVAAEPGRVWNLKEAAAIMGIDPKRVTPMLVYPLRAGLVYRAMDGRRSIFAGQPFTERAMKLPPPPKAPKGTQHWATSPDDLRIPRVVRGWAPPQMVCARAVA